MIQDFLQLLPAEAGQTIFGIAVGGTIVGALLWLAGGKFSRPIITLITVLLGAAIGMRLPAWCKWNVSGAGPAVGGAVLLGVSGFVLHRMWVGIGLGLVLASWTTFITWMLMHDGRAWNWPAFSSDTTIFSYAHDLWKQVPPNIARILPFACSASLISGLAAAILWPRLTTVLNWSSAGASLLAATGIAAVAFKQPMWLNHLPKQTITQVATLVGMILVGAALQWRITPAALFAGGAEGGKPSSSKKSASKSSKGSGKDDK